MGGKHYYEGMVKNNLDVENDSFTLKTIRLVSVEIIKSFGPSQPLPATLLSALK